MAKTLVSIQRQIEKLQKEASALKAKEVGGVIERIQAAIAFYGLTAADLFDTKTKPSASGKAKRTVATKTTAAVKKEKKEKKVAVIKYKDEAGNAWTGHGKRPAWFKAALESGKTAEDLRVKPTE